MIGSANKIVYWIKSQREVCAILTYFPDHDEYLMEITDLNLFRGYAPKVILTDPQVREWMDRRLRPEYQVGYADVIKELGLDINDPKHREKMFFETRGCNVDDKLWLAYDPDEPYENAPIYITEIPWDEENYG